MAVSTVTTLKFPIRYGQMVALWMAVVLSYVLRINMSVGVVAMTGTKFTADQGSPSYNWKEAEKSRVLSSFFWGYIVLQIFFGNFVEKVGTKNVLAVSMLVTSISTVIIPFAAEYGSTVVMILRILEGLSQGALYPCVTVHISRWVPPVERVRSLSLCFSGSAFGPLIGFPLCGYLSASGGGWPSIFYVTGGLGFVWVMLWFWIGANSPEEHTTISKVEQSYIETAIQRDVNAISPDPRTPWKEIFTTVPVYAMVIASIVEMWGYWTLLAEMPNYLSSVLSLDMKENGLLSSLPYLCAYMTTIMYSCIASYVTKHCRISKTLHRNIWNSISMWGSSSALVILSLMDTPSTFTAVLLLVLTVSMMTAKYNGYMTNPIDLSPNFCGTLVGIISTAGTLGPILGPLSVGWLVDDPRLYHQNGDSVIRNIDTLFLNSHRSILVLLILEKRVSFTVLHLFLSTTIVYQRYHTTYIAKYMTWYLVKCLTSEEQWNVVFRLCSGIMFTGNFLYVILSSSEIQPWNNQSDMLHVKDPGVICTVENCETNTKL